MITKYNVGDEVIIKAKVARISINRKSKIEYGLDIENVISFEPTYFSEEQIIGRLEENNEVRS